VVDQEMHSFNHNGKARNKATDGDFDPMSTTQPIEEVKKSTQVECFQTWHPGAETSIENLCLPACFGSLNIVTNAPNYFK
jgi:hypothetical protein